MNLPTPRIESFWLEIPRKTQREIIKRQQKWRLKHIVEGTDYFVLAIQPFAFDGKIKVSIIPGKLGDKITKTIAAFKRKAK